MSLLFPEQLQADLFPVGDFLKQARRISALLLEAQALLGTDLTERFPQTRQFQ